jgi:hypothetical protein
LLVAVGIQFVPVDRTNPPVRTDVAAPAEVASILRRACYDCHSNETSWPWYSHVAPASWFVARHVRHGRGDLNFSEWPLFDMEAEAEAFKDIEAQVEKGEMPLPSYTWIHRDAALGAEDRETLLRWARSMD